MSGLSELAHFWGNDANTSSTGDLLLVDGSARGQQRVLRRLLTNPATFDSFGKLLTPADYPFHPEYGAGLPAQVGETLSIPKIRGLIRSQMLLEESVAKSPEPQINIGEIAGGILVDLQYTDAFSNKAVVLSINVTA